MLDVKCSVFHFINLKTFKALQILMLRYIMLNVQRRGKMNDRIFIKENTSKIDSV